MIDPEDPPEVQVVKQSKIIDALLRRAGRHHEVGTTAYSAFQSAVSLQEQVWAKARDLERASNELAQLRRERERAQKNFADALSVMEGGFALFSEGRLQICNDQFRHLLPDVTEHVFPGTGIDAYFDRVLGSAYLVTTEGEVREDLQRAKFGPETVGVTSFVLELTGDTWFQINMQRTSSDNVIVLQTEITGIVRASRSEKDQLIDRQAHYLQAAFDHMSLGICTFARSGTVMISNERFRSLLGLPFALVRRGTRFDDILAFLKTTGTVVAGGADNRVEHWPHRLRAEGQLRQRLFNVRGQVLDLHLHTLPDRGFLADIADVSLEHRATEMLERRVEERTSELTEANRRLTDQYEAQARVEDELRLAKEAAEAAMSSKTRFLAAASHDLLQPVNAAKILISTLVDQSRGTEMHRLIQRLDRSFESMETLMHAILDISRLDSAGEGLVAADLCLGEIIDAVVSDQAAFAASRGVALNCVTSSAWVHSDYRYLMRSVRNLIVNAVQYTPEGGRVLVGCRHRGSKVVLEVWDTGIGISRRDQARIFEEFARADNATPGSGLGLGLSIVDRTCRHMGHGVGVRSKPGVGSVFWIEMNCVPRHHRNAENDLASTAEMTLPDADMDVVALVVESDPDVLFATVNRLESWGASVLGAHSTEEALALVHDIGCAPDIVIVDYRLERDDTGFRTVAEIRRATGQHVPAIMITSWSGGVLDEAAQTYDLTVLAKPVDPSRLRPLIDWKTRAAGCAGVAGTDESLS